MGNALHRRLLARWLDVFAVLEANKTIQRVGNAAVWYFLLRALALGALLFAAYVTFRYIHQPLADAHAGRQTQTALASYWMLKEGWRLAYQTPVAGFPWSIPFEFPIYQTLVATISGIFGFDLAAVGRFVSFLFLAACAWPAFAISRRLQLPASVAWVFCALLWTSPLYVYWGRTFMIETAALFFAFSSIPFAIDLINRKTGWRHQVLFVLFASAAVLQKATPIGMFSIPIVIGLAWAHYADMVKAENPFGSQLTSKALWTWNFGSIEQKFSPKNWRLVVWDRSFLENAGGWFGVGILILPWLAGRQQRHLAWLALAALVLFLMPIVIFTNLHIVHPYYQVACVLFLIAGLSIVIGGWLQEALGIKALAPIFTVVLMVSNIVAFYSGYGIVAARKLLQSSPGYVQSYSIAHYLRDHTPANTGLVIFGKGWSSEIAFPAQRKCMTAPTWFKQYRKVWKDPRAYLGNLDLGAIVVCPSPGGFPGESDVQERVTREPGWKLVTIAGCEILLPNGVQ
jgi:hypothetical protein